MFKPKSSFGVNEAINLISKKDGGSDLIIGSIDQGVIDGVNYQDEGHKVFAQLKDRFFFLTQ